MRTMLFAVHTFSDAYAQADFFGKLIFLGLFALSAVCWMILVQKLWVMHSVKRLSRQFLSAIGKQIDSFFSLSLDQLPKRCKKGIPHPFFHIAATVNETTKQLLDKNRYFAQGDAPVYLSRSDIELIDGHLHAVIMREKGTLEKNLFLLSTIASLAPFLGLLGTVWGILITFSELKTGASFGANNAILGGLSTALVTTVLGLLIAIPALIGFSYLRQGVRNYVAEMQDFTHQLISTIEIQYRKVDTLSS